MTDLLILRHAPTAWNAAGRIQGRIDEPLSDAGRARAAGWRLPDGARSRRWVASPLRRAWETAALLGLTPEPEPRLREMHWGAWEGCVRDDLRAAGVLTPAMEALGLDLRPHGGESPRDVQDRLRPWLAELAADGRDTGAVAHNGVIRAVYALATGWDLVSRPRHKLRDFHCHRFRIGPGGAVAVVAMNIPLEAPADAGGSDGRPGA
ncbi:histidine phosphatase family protein [Azospirillum halopraeferens]|uniref:histidine phosphatase family protein n=1 Tax=Azospirillum halopraeferens TaxID=34010 RepID=UPI000411C1F1|nr:histidine phosphatase family protein [Azospirillum halopraeferens]